LSYGSYAEHAGVAVQLETLLTEMGGCYFRVSYENRLYQLRYLVFFSSEAYLGLK